MLKVRQDNAQDAILFESIVICEYLDETQGGAPMYPVDALARARNRAWIEFASQTQAEAWQFLHARDSATADAKRTAFRERLGKLESEIGVGPFFNGSAFGMVDAVYAPLFRYFESIDATVAHQIFDGLPRISAWREALEARSSVREAVVEDYADRFQTHLLQQGTLIAAAYLSVTSLGVVARRA